MIFYYVFTFNKQLGNKTYAKDVYYRWYWPGRYI